MLCQQRPSKTQAEKYSLAGRFGGPWIQNFQQNPGDMRRQDGKDRWAEGREKGKNGPKGFCVFLNLPESWAYLKTESMERKDSNT